MSNPISVSLVIPVFNESASLSSLIKTINDQTFPPSGIILVDGGSTDNTVQLINELTNTDPRFRIIEAGRAMPGRGRNIGSAEVHSDWIAYTDAGIRLHERWLEHLVQKTIECPEADIVYGNYSPEINTLFDKCAAIAYVAPLQPGHLRSRFIASALVKKKVWEQTGGFPDWRATEDLVFMEKAEQAGFHIMLAPEAMVYWQLRPNLKTTFRRFDLYSKYNVWAGRQAFWHYGVARQYGVLLVAVLLGIFHSWYWLLILPLWIVARVAKRIWLHRREFGLGVLFNPLVFFNVMVILLAIDVATFSGWIKALVNKKQGFSK